MELKFSKFMLNDYKLGFAISITAISFLSLEHLFDNYANKLMQKNH